mgnify:CR=1 FL=1
MPTIEYLPEVFREIKEIKVVTHVQDKENAEINKNAEDLYKDQFVVIATEKGIARYEKMLGLTYKGTDTLEDRRFRVLTEYNKQLPYTKVTMKQTLESLCGKDGYRLKIDYENNILTLKIALTAKSQFETLQEYMENVTPLNFILDVALLYNQHKLLSQFTHAELANYTHLELREEVL